MCQLLPSDKVDGWRLESTESDGWRATGAPRLEKQAKGGHNAWQERGTILLHNALFKETVKIQISYD